MNTDEKIVKILENQGKVLEELQKSQVRLEQGQAQTNKKLSELTVDMADFFHKTWEKMDETDERVTIIEDHLGLANPVKKN